MADEVAKQLHEDELKAEQSEERAISDAVLASTRSKPTPRS
jgi:hypothetical protein